jgi:predicted amidophosphoribosyltransferase
VRDRGRWAGARLALVDDTFTTGSTLNAAAEVCIKKAKVAEVIPLTLAYTARRAT